MDVLNFISWLKSKRQVTTVDASQTLIPLGLKDARRSDGYLPGAISVEDLLAGATPPVLPNDNTAYGENALIALTTASLNSMYGSFAGKSTTKGSGNTGIGAESLYNNVSGFANTAIGSQSLYVNTVGYENIGIGTIALPNNTTGANNIGIGSGALNANTIGVYNIVIGTSGGSGSGTENFNIGIGSGTIFNGYSSSIILGTNAAATGSNQFIVGSNSHAAGAIATEALTPTISWRVKINGVDYKIPLQIA
jgi:hypothetical protein